MKLIFASLAFVLFFPCVAMAQSDETLNEDVAQVATDAAALQADQDRAAANGIGIESSNTMLDQSILDEDKERVQQDAIIDNEDNY